MSHVSIFGWSFRPRLAVSIATVVTVSVTVALGHWQQERAEFKEALAAQLASRESQPPVLLPADAIEPAGIEFRRVMVRGEFDAAKTLLLDNKVLRGVPGFHVITPLRIDASSRYVLVDRGWIAAGPRRDQLPHVETPTGVLSLEGIAVVPSPRFFELGPESVQGPIRQNLVISRIASELDLPLQPVVVQQTSIAPDGLVREWERPDTGVEKHRAYSLQWFSLAALAVILYVVLNLKRRAPDRG